MKPFVTDWPRFAGGMTLAVLSMILGYWIFKPRTALEGSGRDPRTFQANVFDDSVNGVRCYKPVGVYAISCVKVR